MFRPLIAASLSALLLAGTAAQAAEDSPATARHWQTEVERRIDRELANPAVAIDGVRMTEVAMRFDAQGNFQSASVRKSSGETAMDAEALRVANSIRYPRLPLHLRGKPQSVAMQIIMGTGNAMQDAQRDAHKAAVARAADADANRAHAEIAVQPEG